MISAETKSATVYISCECRQAEEPPSCLVSPGEPLSGGGGPPGLGLTVSSVRPSAGRDWLRVDGVGLDALQAEALVRVALDPLIQVFLVEGVRLLSVVAGR